jgi:DNA-binding NtrC family response regulator
MESGALRPDLYYRLAELTAEVAPLRGRRDDIPVPATRAGRLIRSERQAKPRASRQA